MRRAGEWTTTDVRDMRRLPIVPAVDKPRQCFTRHVDGWFCNRRRGHGGRHAAHARGGLVVAVWHEPEATS